MQLQLKISKTRKRLSRDLWLAPAATLALACLFIVLIAAMEVASIPLSYGVLSLDIPVVSIPYEDPGLSDFKVHSDQAVSDTSPMIVLNAKGDFFFGETRAFSVFLHDTRNKFIVSAVEGRPNLPKLLETMALWRKQRAEKDGQPIVFLPSPQAPLSVVLKILGELKRLGPYQKIVLGTGMI